jgi:ankyrin repeat protein
MLPVRVLDAANAELFEQLMVGNFEFVTPENVNSVDVKGRTALFYAIAGNPADFTEIISTLLSKGADASIKDNYEMSAWIFYASKGHLGGVNFLFCRDTVNAVDSKGQTALDYAIARDALDVVAFLVAKGADTDACDDNGLTPMLKAAKACNVKILQMLVLHMGNKTPTTVVDNDGKGLLAHVVLGAFDESLVLRALEVLSWVLLKGYATVGEEALAKLDKLAKEDCQRDVVASLRTCYLDAVPEVLIRCCAEGAACCH